MVNTEEGGDDVKSSRPLRPGLHTCYNGYYKELRYSNVERISERHMKSELLVIPNQHVGVNAFPGLVHTARHAMGVGSTQSQSLNRKGRAA